MADEIIQKKKSFIPPALSNVQQKEQRHFFKRCKTHL